MAAMDVLVIGAGVIGLSAAIHLQEAGHRVVIWAADLPQETTSAVAAALWYPYKAYPADRVAAWGRRSYEVFAVLADDPASGVRMVKGIELRHGAASDHRWSDVAADLRRCTADDLPDGYSDGHLLTAPVAAMPTYLNYLSKRFHASGGWVEQRRIGSLAEVSAIYPRVVNCTGLGSRTLLGDGELVPIRGQVVRVENPGIDRFVLDEGNPAGVTYIIPRGEDCILGGTAEVGRWDTEPDPETARSIQNRCMVLEPALAGARVLGHGVGLRPGRSTVRLEAETLAGGASVVHNYGHGGAGMTLSWGCAEEVAEMMR